MFQFFDSKNLQIIYYKLKIYIKMIRKIIIIVVTITIIINNNIKIDYTNNKNDENKEKSQIGIKDNEKHSTSN